jgi:tetratricopeptide (TPR) repeat protein
MNDYIKILTIILNTCVLTCLHGQQFKTNSSSVGISKNINSDSSLIDYKQSYEKALIAKDTSEIIKSLISQSIYNRKNLDYGSAFNNSGEALFLAEEIKDTLLLAHAYEELGVLSYLFKQDEEAGYNFKNAHEYYKALYREKIISLTNIYQSHYNLVLYYQRTENIKLLKPHIDSCFSIAKKTKQNSIYEVYLDEKNASLEEWGGNPQKALELLIKSATTLENIRNNSDLSDTNKSFLIIIYGRIGNLYMKLGQINLAKNYYDKSIQIEDVSGENTFYKSFIYSHYSALLSRMGNFKQAYENQQKSIEINNTYLNPRNDKNQGFLTIKNRYKDELNKKNNLLNTQNLELAERNEKILRFRIFFFIALFLLIITGFIIRSRIKFLKHQKKEQDSKESIDIKNKELTVSTLQLIEKEVAIKALSDHIKKSDLDSGTRALLKSIEKRSVSLWDAFNNRFTAQNKDFYERLLKEVPNLSSSDLKICALIKLNFSGKEMAYLLGISLGSVHVARHRLRKKMNLERDANLTNSINSI